MSSWTPTKCINLISNTFLLDGFFIFLFNIQIKLTININGILHKKELLCIFYQFTYLTTYFISIPNTHLDL